MPFRAPRTAPGVIYPTLTLLKDMGLVSEPDTTDTQRKLFAITEQGKALLAENAKAVEGLLRRLGEAAEIRERTDAAPVRRAMQNLLVGDESALPALGRRVELLRPGVPVTTVAVVANESEQQTFVTQASWHPTWVVRGEPGPGDGALLRRELAKFTPPLGEGFVWLAGEAEWVRELRTYVIEERGHPAEWVKAASYWHRDGDGGHAGPVRHH